jgi:hypothetical protein
MTEALNTFFRADRLGDPAQSVRVGPGEHQVTTYRTAVLPRVFVPDVHIDFAAGKP